MRRYRQRARGIDQSDRGHTQKGTDESRPRNDPTGWELKAKINGALAESLRSTDRPSNQEGNSSIIPALPYVRFRINRLDNPFYYKKRTFLVLVF